ncbi:MAG: hypothetical protein GY719_11225 [bacterium]|nr:hypothetical protein [bacterium]
MERVAISLAGTLLQPVLVLAPLAAAGSLDVARRDGVIVAFALLAMFACLAESLASQPIALRPGRSEAPASLPYLTGLALLLCFWAGVAERGLSPEPASGLLVSGGGAGLLLLGVGLRILAIRTLGAWFVSEVRVVAGQRLVTYGIYQFLRHPSEAGTLCLGFGGGLMLGSKVALVVAGGLLLPSVLWRIRVEDRALAHHLGEEFHRHARSVSALIPRWAPPAWR